MVKRAFQAVSDVSEVSKVSEFDTIDTDRHDPRVSSVEIASFECLSVSERVGEVSNWCR